MTDQLHPDRAAQCIKDWHRATELGFDSVASALEALAGVAFDPTPPNLSANTQAEKDERAAFEEWHGGLYRSLYEATAWAAWQARASLQKPAKFIPACGDIDCQACDKVPVKEPANPSRLKSQGFDYCIHCREKDGYHTPDCPISPRIET